MELFPTQILSGAAAEAFGRNLQIFPAVFLRTITLKEILSTFQAAVPAKTGSKS